MNKLFLRTIKRNFVDRRLINPICKHYQLDIMRQPQIPTQIILIDDLFVQNYLKHIEPEPIKEKLVIPGPPENEFDFLNKIELKSVMRMNTIINKNKRNLQKKKQIMTPNGIRTEKLVIPGPPRNELNCL